MIGLLREKYAVTPAISAGVTVIINKKHFNKKIHR